MLKLTEFIFSLLSILKTVLLNVVWPQITARDNSSETNVKSLDTGQPEVFPALLSTKFPIAGATSFLIKSQLNKCWIKKLAWATTTTAAQ